MAWVRSHPACGPQSGTCSFTITVSACACNLLILGESARVTPSSNPANYCLVCQYTAGNVDVSQWSRVASGNCCDNATLNKTTQEHIGNVEEYNCLCSTVVVADCAGAGTGTSQTASLTPGAGLSGFFIGTGGIQRCVVSTWAWCELTQRSEASMGTAETDRGLLTGDQAVCCTVACAYTKSMSWTTNESHGLIVSFWKNAAGCPPSGNILPIILQADHFGGGAVLDTGGSL